MPSCEALPEPAVGGYAGGATKRSHVRDAYRARLGAADCRWGMEGRASSVLVVFRLLITKPWLPNHMQAMMRPGKKGDT